ncbi:oligosaccharide flippase family protein [Methyloglobulus sp.]|uniref:oligosaccharide flippase family protein n=1 Tax=Methyloglobulus sp. TaxID=2518622 RepID=UPI001823EC96|nr:oligosaccharide flippase family protein [Methyloglobulus sp.]
MPMQAQAKPKTLKKRAFAASRWALVGHLSSQAIRFGGNLILTRLLVPEMFGVMAIVNAIMTGLSMISDIGISQNVVQNKRGEDPVFLNTVWTIQILRGISVCGLVLLTSFGLYQANVLGFIPQTMVYANKDLPFLLGIIAMGVFISSFNSIHLILLNRKLQLGKSVFIEITSQILGLAVIIYIAWHERTVYALASGNIVTSTTKLLLSHLIIKERCRFAWDKETVTDIAHFGRWILVSSILGFLFNQGDRLLLGAFITPELLGVYTVAFFLANAVKDVLSKLLSSVFYPVLSDTVRNRPERLKQVYYKIRHRIDAVAMFSSGFLFTAGGRVVDLLYDNRYHEAGWMLQILALSMASVGFTLAGQCFMAHGRSAMFTLMVGSQTLALYTTLPLAYMEYGLRGAIWAIACTPLIRLVISGIFMKIHFFFHLGKELLMLPMLFLGAYLGKLAAGIYF